MLLRGLRLAAGIDPAGTRPLRKAGKSPLHHELLQKRIAELKSRIPVGGLREAIIRALLYVGTGRAAVDERGFEALRRIRRAHGDMPLSAFKALVRDAAALVRHVRSLDGSGIGLVRWVQPTR